MRVYQNMGLRCHKPVMLYNVALVFLLIAGVGIIAAVAFGAYFAINKPTSSADSESRLFSPSKIYAQPEGPKKTSTIPIPIGGNGVVHEVEMQPGLFQPIKPVSATKYPHVIIGPRLPNGWTTTRNGLTNRRVGGAVTISSGRKRNYTSRTAMPTTVAPRTTLTPPDSATRRPLLTSTVRITVGDESFIIETGRPGPAAPPSNAGSPEFGHIILGPGGASSRHHARQTTIDLRAKPTTTATPQNPRPPVTNTSPVQPRPAQPTEDSGTHQIQLSQLGKLGGIAYHNGLLYVPSNTNGKIVVMHTPSLNIVHEILCMDCTIYDLDVMTSGDLILAHGDQQKLTRMDAQTGQIINQVDLGYNTKGVAVTSNDDILVLPRSHDTIFIYNSDLEYRAAITIPNKALADCNFLTVNTSNILFVSCEDGVHVLDIGGQLVSTLLPPQGSYSVGIAVDEAKHILVVRRGTGIVDIWSSDGNLLETLGADASSFWSDIAVGRGHLYVVEYITATVKVFMYA